MAEYLETDEQSDVLDSLREVLHQLDRIQLNVGNWKWAVIALSSAINGSMTCNLTGTMQIGALEKNKIEPTIAAMHSHSTTQLPEPRLASPLDLLKRIKKVDRFEKAGSPIEVTPAQETSVKRLYDLRNQFMHFSPCSWLIEVNGLPDLFSNVISLISSIRNDGWSFRHLDQTNAADLEFSLQSIQLRLNEIKRR